MAKFIPYKTLSKRKKRELDRKRRNTRGALSPGTRRAENRRAYNRKRTRRRDLVEE